MYAEVVIKDVNVAKRISVEKRVASAGRFLHVRLLMKVTCESCNRNFRSRSCFEKHKTNKLEGKIVCEKVRNCPVCKACVTRKNHECFKPYCPKCNKNMEINHLYYMQPLKNEVPRSDDVLFVLYDFETTQDTKISETARVHVPILVCLQQICTACEMQDDYSQDCARCGNREHSFFKDLLAICFRT